MDTLSVAAPIPEDEHERLQDLYSYEILDSDPQEPFDDIARMAAAICGTRWAVVNFIDEQRQWSKAFFELVSEECDRHDAFCPHTIVAPEGFLQIEDTHVDERFARNPNVVDDPHIRFYAGSAIRARSGRPIGTVCVVDSAPRALTREQQESLRSLSRLATSQLELRRLLSSQRSLVDELRELDRQKAEFTAVVAHDFRSPLTSILGYAELLREEEIPLDEGLAAIERGSDRLIRLVDDLVDASPELTLGHADLAELGRAAADLARPAAHEAGVRIEIDVAPTPVVVDAARIAQALDNLVGNAVKYSPGGVVRVTAAPQEGGGVITVADTGVGIPEHELHRLFDRFYRASTSNGFEGTGIGLATVKSIVDAHGGTVSVRSSVGEGTAFTVELPAR